VSRSFLPHAEGVCSPYPPSLPSGEANRQLVARNHKVCCYCLVALLLPAPTAPPTHTQANRTDGRSRNQKQGHLNRKHDWSEDRNWWGGIWCKGWWGRDEMR